MHKPQTCLQTTDILFCSYRMFFFFKYHHLEICPKQPNNTRACFPSCVCVRERERERSGVPKREDGSTRRFFLCFTVPLEFGRRDISLLLGGRKGVKLRLGFGERKREKNGGKIPRRNKTKESMLS